MDRPTAKRVRELTPRTNWAQLGYPPTGEPDTLAVEVEVANAYIEWATGRLLDDSMPAGLAPLAEKAVALRVQQLVNVDDPETMEGLTGGAAGPLRSFSVTGYSEQYEDVGTAQKAENEARMINPWPELNRLLWALVTLERYGWWRAFLEGGLIPAWGVLEVDWSGANRWGGIAGIMSPGLPGDLPGYGGGGLGWPGEAMWATGSNTGSNVVLGWP